MNIVALLPFIVLIGAMFLMTRSAKNKQRAAQQMRNDMQPGTGVRTIGGLYATVKEVNDDTVVVEIAPGVHATFAKNAIGAVLEDEEYERIVNGAGHVDPLKGDVMPIVPDSPAGLEPVDLSKPAQDDHPDTDPDLSAGDGAADESDDDARAAAIDADELGNAKARAAADADGEGATKGVPAQGKKGVKGAKSTKSDGGDSAAE